MHKKTTGNLKLKTLRAPKSRVTVKAASEEISMTKSHNKEASVAKSASAKSSTGRVLAAKGARTKAPNGGTSAQSICDSMRLRIVSGELAPGDQLPTRITLENQFGASSLTVQRAFDMLARDEFVCTNGRRGTYVVEAPPHLTRYALVFRHHPRHESAEWTTLYSALSNEAMALHGAGEYRVAIYTGVASHSGNTDYARLLREVRAHRLAGLIFADGMGGFEGTPLLLGDIPRVLLMTDHEEADQTTHKEGVHGVTMIVVMAMLSLIDRALDDLKAQGKTRIALLSHRAPNTEFNTYFQRQAKARGLETRDFWIQSCSVDHRASARPLMNLLMHRSTTDQPDSLIITDDNLVESATQGLVDAGVLVPRDFRVVAHANFPFVTQSHVPCRRLGIDTSAVLSACLRAVADARRNGIPTPDATSLYGEATALTQMVPVSFEDEISTRRLNAPSDQRFASKAR